MVCMLECLVCGSRLSGLHDGSAAAGRQGGAAAPWAMTGSYLVRVIFHALVQVESPGSGRLTPDETHRSTGSFTESTTVDSFTRRARTPKPAVSGRLDPGRGVARQKNKLQGPLVTSTRCPNEWYLVPASLDHRLLVTHSI